MRLAKTFLMVVSECKLLLRFVGKLIFYAVLVEVQSSCSTDMSQSLRTASMYGTHCILSLDVIQIICGRRKLWTSSSGRKPMIFFTLYMLWMRYVCVNITLSSKQPVFLPKAKPCMPHKAHARGTYFLHLKLAYVNN